MKLDLWAQRLDLFFLLAGGIQPLVKDRIQFHIFITNPLGNRSRKNRFSFLSSVSWVCVLFSLFYNMKIWKRRMLGYECRPGFDGWVQRTRMSVSWLNHEKARSSSPNILIPFPLLGFSWPGLFEPGGYSLRNQAKGMLEVLRLAVCSEFDSRVSVRPIFILFWEHTDFLRI